MRKRIGFLLLLSAPSFCLAADLRLVEAAQAQDRDLVRTLLDQHVDVNTPQGDGATALHWAVYWDDPAMTDILIRAGANVNATNELGVTPLALASSGAMAGLLLDAGANPNLVTATGESPLMAASRAGRADIASQFLA